MVNAIPPLSQNDKDRFERHIVKTDACWAWLGKKFSKTGRGMFNVGGKTYYAPRISYALYFGSVPTEKLVLHKCDNPNCVNPDHLFLGTQIENISDRDAKNRNRHSHKFCVNGHEFTPENTRIYGPNGRYRMCRACARENERKYRAKFITRIEAEKY